MTKATGSAELSEIVEPEGTKVLATGPATHVSTLDTVAASPVINAL